MGFTPGGFRLSPGTKNTLVKKYIEQYGPIPEGRFKITKLTGGEAKIKKAIDDTYKRVRDWHLKHKPKDIFYKDKFKNKLEYKYLPIESVAIYVPGSSASYPSSVLMNAIPAMVAGVKRIIMISCLIP